jgi:RHS repeat-associated protein
LMDYYPFGSMRLDQKAGSFNEQKKFAGHEYDQDTGLSYMEARYYNGNIGKFVSQDPAFWNFSRLQTQLSDPQSWNSYAYGRNNPIKHNDPDGQFWDTVVDVGFTAWDGSRFMQHAGNWLGDQASIGLGKLTGSSRLENNGRVGSIQSGSALKSASIDLGIDIGATLLPGVPAFVGRVDDVAKLTNKIDRSAGIIEVGVKEAAKIDAQRAKIIQQAMKTGEPEVVRIANRLFKPFDTVPGGTAGAYKFEQQTGKLLSPTGHGQAAQNTISWINNTIGNVNDPGKNLLNSFKKGLERVTRTQY